MAKRERKNRIRRTRESMRKYGKNKRQIWNEYPAIHLRLAYACNVLFGGDSHEFAAAAGLCYRHLSRVLRKHSCLSMNMAAQIVSRTGIRAEWLMCGVGSMLADVPENYNGLLLPPQLQSSFRLFDAIQNNPGTEFFPPEQVLFTDAPISNIAPYEDAGRVIYAAHANSKSVGFFLGSETFALPAAQFVLPFFQSQYADFLVLTLAAAAHDVYATHTTRPVDLNAVARFAAERGMGYGEAVGLVGVAADADRQKSVLASVRDLGLPAFILAEIGELGRHTAPNMRGAEIGAAIGAAAYVDLFAYTEQLKYFFGQPGGVMVIAGECHRGVRLFLARLETLKLSVPHQTGFTFVLFTPPDGALQTEIQTYGGNVIFLDKPTITTLSQLFQTCNDVYAGTLSSHERRHISH